MSTPDDLQKLWQGEDAKLEDHTIWRALIQEKRRGWDELVRAEDQAWYLAALCFVPLTAWAAWKAKYTWVHVGYGLMAVTLVFATIATWIEGRQRPQEHNSNLRDYLQALLASYERRSILLRRGGRWAMGGLTAGLAAIFLGMPGGTRSWRSWIITTLLVAGANAAWWLSCKQTVAKISQKRDEATRLLQSLLSNGG